MRHPILHPILKKLSLAVMICVVFLAHNSGLVVNAAQRDRDVHYIPLLFFIYEEPNFRSPIIASFAAQRVNVIERVGNGWGLISTDYGPGWAYLPGNRFFIPRNTGLFEYIGAENYTALVAPQVVTVLDAVGSWRLIYTWVGYMWIDVNFTPPTSGLDAYLRRFGNSIAVFYMDITTGFTYIHNPDRVFFSASVNKLQHGLYLYMLAERGLLDLERVHTYTTSDYWEGTGIMRNMNFGRRFTTQELPTMSIRHSDNIAFRMLTRRYGLNGFLEFAREIGANESLFRTMTYSNVTARDAGVWAHAAYMYLTSGGTHSETFLTDLMNTNTTLVHANYPIANKYGWATASFHDMAIVFAESPYILVILSTLDQGAFGTFASISRQVEAFHHRYF